MGHGRGVKHKLKLNVNGWMDVIFIAIHDLGWMDVIFIAIHDLINRSVLIQRQRLIISQLFVTDNIVIVVDQTNLHTQQYGVKFLLCTIFEMELDRLCTGAPISFSTRLSTDPSTGPMRSPFSTNQTQNVAVFSTYFFVSHTGITNNSSAHTDSVRFYCFWFNRPNTAKWL